MKKYKSNEKIIKGRWYNINKKIKKKLIAKYHKIKDWRMDPKGYFLIAVNKRKKNIQVGYCKFTRLGNTPLNDMVAIIEGKTKFEGAELMSSDLRASVALVLAAIVANGVSVINRIYHLDRGYENIEKKLSKLGVNIRRIY